MKKLQLISLIIVLITNYSYGQSKDVSNYFPITETSDTAKLFKMKNASYLDYFRNEKSDLNKEIYSERIRIYSWGKQDTSYFREDSDNFYHYNPKTGNENIVLPKKIFIDQTWTEKDGSWAYKVISLDKTFKTPEKTFQKTIVIECRQLTNRDSKKSEVYHMYYAENIGLVGSDSNGELSSFFSQYKNGKKK